MAHRVLSIELLSHLTTDMGRFTIIAFRIED
jgi:hypothetical protein